MDPNRRRLDDLLARRYLWDDEVSEVQHLAGLCGVQVEFERLDLTTGQVMKDEV